MDLAALTHVQRVKMPKEGYVKRRGTEKGV
jgi:hypothetical protein